MVPQMPEQFPLAYGLQVRASFLREHWQDTGKGLIKAHNGRGKEGAVSSQAPIAVHYTPREPGWARH